MVEVKIEKQRDNPLLKRKEIWCRIVYGNEPSPKRDQIRDIISRNLGADKSLVMVDRSIQETGKHQQTSYVKIYSDKKSAMLYEPDYILIRNGLKEKKEGA